MIITEPSAIVLQAPTNPLQIIEQCGRTCYLSHDNTTPDSAQRFVRNLIARGHLSVLEHVSVTLGIVCDRGVSHELVRHRIASYSQESTRYVNYNRKGMVFIRPSTLRDEIPATSEPYRLWQNHMEDCEAVYNKMLENGATPEQARSVLPNSLKTEICVTMNLRAWMNFLDLRDAKPAHPDMREVAQLCREQLQKVVPIIFE